MFSQALISLLKVFSNQTKENIGGGELMRMGTLFQHQLFHPPLNHKTDPSLYILKYSTDFLVKITLDNFIRVNYNEA